MRWIAAYLAVSALAVAQSAQAGPILSGSFSSVATSGSFQTNQGSVNVAGTTVTGTLDLSSIAGATSPAGLPAGDYLLQPGAVTLSFDIVALGQNVVFTSAGSGEHSEVELTDNGTMQTVLLAPAFVDPHMTTSEELTGPEGSLFGNIDDLASLHIGPGVTLASPIFLSVYQEGGATLAVTGETLASASIPEPATWPLLAMSAVALSITLRARRRAL